MAYRARQGIDPADVRLAVVVQRLVEATGAGVMFTADPGTGRRDAVVISAAWGLGETVVQGTINPDKYQVFKPLLADDRFSPVIDRERGAKERKMVYSLGGNARTRMVETRSPRATVCWPGRAAFQASLSARPAAAARPASRSLIVT